MFSIVFCSLHEPQFPDNLTSLSRRIKLPFNCPKGTFLLTHTIEFHSNISESLLTIVRKFPCPTFCDPFRPFTILLSSLMFGYATCPQKLKRTLLDFPTNRPFSLARCPSRIRIQIGSFLFTGHVCFHASPYVENGINPGIARSDTN